eukprot:NODE_714_length_4512_cov_0.872876.p2 type:complete len:254 gc:universal NODE_714_length_4512_cov_0.872876:3587-2826(-)
MNWFMKIGFLIILSQLGTLIRLLIKFSWTTTYYNQLSANLIIQMVGSFIMGISSNHPDEKYIALALCGSITTFSGWIYILVQLDPSWASLWLLPTFSLFVAAFKLGFKACLIIPTPSEIPCKFLYALMGYASLIICLVLSLLDFTDFALPLLLSPFGVLCRYLVSFINNPNVKYRVYLGTFLINFTGTLGLILLYKFTTKSSVIIAIADGFFGCYTTISSVARDVAQVEVAKIWVFSCIFISWLISLIIWMNY